MRAVSVDSGAKTKNPVNTWVFWPYYRKKLRFLRRRSAPGERPSADERTRTKSPDEEPDQPKTPYRRIASTAPRGHRPPGSGYCIVSHAPHLNRGRVSARIGLQRWASSRASGRWRPRRSGTRPARRPGRARPRTRGSARSVPGWGRAASGSGFRGASPRAFPAMPQSWPLMVEIVGGAAVLKRYPVMDLEPRRPEASRAVR